MVKRPCNRFTCRVLSNGLDADVLVEAFAKAKDSWGSNHNLWPVSRNTADYTAKLSSFAGALRIKSRQSILASPVKKGKGLVMASLTVSTDSFQVSQRAQRTGRSPTKKHHQYFHAVTSRVPVNMQPPKLIKQNSAMAKCRDHPLAQNADSGNITETGREFMRRSLHGGGGLAVGLLQGIVQSLKLPPEVSYSLAMI